MELQWDFNGAKVADGRRLGSAVWKNHIGKLGEERAQLLAEFPELSVLSDFLGECTIVAYGGGRNGKGKLHKDSRCSGNRYERHPASKIPLEKLLTERHLPHTGVDAWCEKCYPSFSVDVEGPVIANDYIEHAVDWTQTFMEAVAELQRMTAWIESDDRFDFNSGLYEYIESIVFGDTGASLAALPSYFARSGFDFDAAAVEAKIDRLCRRIRAAHASREEQKALHLEDENLFRHVIDTHAFNDVDRVETEVEGRPVIRALNSVESGRVEEAAVEAFAGETVWETQRQHLAAWILTERLRSGELNPIDVDQLVEQNDLDYGDAVSFQDRAVNAVGFYVEDLIEERHSSLKEHYEWLASLNRQPASLLIAGFDARYVYRNWFQVANSKKILDVRTVERNMSAVLVPTAIARTLPEDKGCLVVDAVGEQKDIVEIAEMTVALALDEENISNEVLRRLYDASVAVVRGNTS